MPLQWCFPLPSPLLPFPPLGRKNAIFPLCCYGLLPTKRYTSPKAENQFFNYTLLLLTSLVQLAVVVVELLLKVPISELFQLGCSGRRSESKQNGWVPKIPPSLIKRLPLCTIRSFGLWVGGVRLQLFFLFRKRPSFSSFAFGANEKCSFPIYILLERENLCVGETGNPPSKYTAAKGPREQTGKEEKEFPYLSSPFAEEEKEEVANNLVRRV